MGWAARLFTHLGSWVVVGTAHSLVGRPRTASLKRTIWSAVAVAAIDLYRSRKHHLMLCASDAPLLPEVSIDRDFSIVTPVYNRPTDISKVLVALGDRLDTIDDLKGEVIVVDDGSSDDTAAIAERCGRDLRIDVRVLRKPNGGVASARNFGFAHARGRVVLAIDSDALPEPRWFERLFEAASRGVLYFGSARSDRPAMYPLEVTPAGARYAGVTFAIERDRYLALGGMHERFGHHLEDSDFYLKVRSREQHVEQSDEPLVWHPLRDQSFKDVWTQGLRHEYDALLYARHQRRAHPFLKNVFMIAAIGPHYLLPFVAVHAAAATLATGLDRNGTQRTFRALFLLAATYEVFVTLCALALRVPLRTVPRFALAVHVLGVASIIGRIRGANTDWSRGDNS